MTVWMLPGQGAQAPGMGAGLAESEAAARVFEAGSDVLGVDLWELALRADKPAVDDPFNAQALTAAVSIAAGAELMERGLRPSALVGFSLGQVSALALAGVLAPADAFALLKVRASAMARCCGQRPGGMLALLGVTLAEAESLAARAAEGQVLVVANHNCPGQKVVSGGADAIARCKKLARAEGVRCARLNTAGGFHSPLMHEAAEEVRAACANLTFHAPEVPVLCNTDAAPFAVAEAADRMARQVESPVLFEESIAALGRVGETEFAEVGFGAVLSGLVARINPDATCVQVNSVQQAAEYAAAVQQERER